MSEHKYLRKFGTSCGGFLLFFGIILLVSMYQFEQVTDKEELNTFLYPKVESLVEEECDNYNLSEEDCTELKPEITEMLENVHSLEIPVPMLGKKTLEELNTTSKNSRKYLLLAAILGIIITLFSLKKKTEIFKSVGWTSLSAGISLLIPYILLTKFGTSQFLPQGIGADIADIVSTLLREKVFFYNFYFGKILTVAGIVLVVFYFALDRSLKYFSKRKDSGYVQNN